MKDLTWNLYDLHILFVFYVGFYRLHVTNFHKKNLEWVSEKQGNSKCEVNLSFFFCVVSYIWCKKKSATLWKFEAQFRQWIKWMKQKKIYDVKIFHLELSEKCFHVVCWCFIKIMKWKVLIFDSSQKCVIWMWDNDE